MKTTALLPALLGGIGLLLCVAGTAAAQPGVGITAPSPDRLEGRPPRYERIHPNDVGAGTAGRGVDYTPAFLGPTLEGETTEVGFSAWIAPYTPVGLQPGGGDVSGWAALGVTVTWGVPPRRPSAGTIVR
jgi:hypothetical protein